MIQNFPRTELVKVSPKTKRPMEDNWNEREPKDYDITDWKLSGVNVGLKARNYPAFDIDIDDPIFAKQVFDFINTFLPNGAVRFRDNSARKIVFFSCLENEIVKQVIKTEKGKIELLANGQQFVIHGKHPSGAIFRTENTENIKQVTTEQIQNLFKELQKEFGTEEATEAHTEITTHGEQSIEQLAGIIREWSAEGARYDALKKIIFMNDKEGLSQEQNYQNARLLMMMVPPEKRDETWIDYYEGERLKRLVTDLTKPTIRTVFEDDEEEDKIPKFPYGWMKTLPEPWPLIFKNLSGLSSELVEELLIPTILASHAFLLKNNFTTGIGRRPNMFFLNLAPSTGNKDVNSKNIIRNLDKILSRNGAVSPFAEMLRGESSITADSTFVKSFNESGEKFWINTEATRVFQQLSNANNSSVMGLSDKLIEVVDGFEITGKAGTEKVSVKNISDPNCQVLWYAQPETIEKYINEEMIDSGLFGRTIVTICNPDNFDVDDYDYFSRKGVNAVLSEILKDFYMTGFCARKPTSIPFDFGSHEQIEKIQKFMVDNVTPEIKYNESLAPVLKRIAITAEQLYVVIMGICRLWDDKNEVDARTGFDVELMFPILKYWVDCKVYAVNHLVTESLDEMADEILALLKEILSGKKKLKPAYHKTVKNESVVPMSCFKDFLKKRKRLIRKLQGNDKKDFMIRVDRILKIFINDGILVEKNVGAVKCLGIVGGQGI